MDIYSIIAIALSLFVWIVFLITHLPNKKKTHEPKIKAIRYYSEMNPWMDFCVVCKEEDSETVRKAIIQGMDYFWDGQYVPFGDCVEQSIEDAKVEYSIIYADLDYDNDTDVIYEFIVSSLNPEVLN